MENKKKIEKLKEKIKKLKDIDEEKYKNDIQKLENEIEKLKNPLSVKEINYSRIFFWIFIGVLALLVLTLPTKTLSCSRMISNSENIQVPYDYIETYYEDVPYTDKEYYYEDVPYTDKDCNNINIKYVSDWGQISEECINEICDEHEQYCVKKNFWGNCIEYAERCVNTACTKYRKTCRLEIENIDDTGGTWNIEGYSWNRDLDKKENFIKLISTYIRPTKVGITEWSFIYNAGESMSCWYKIKTIPTKRICENVIKTNSVRKPKDVIKTRSVKKTRQVTKYRIEQEEQDKQENYKKEVNWLFGSC